VTFKVVANTPGDDFTVPVTDAFSTSPHQRPQVRWFSIGADPVPTAFSFEAMTSEIVDHDGRMCFSPGKPKAIAHLPDRDPVRTSVRNPGQG
jgi:hypothetical protein